MKVPCYQCGASDSMRRTIEDPRRGNAPMVIYVCDEYCRLDYEKDLKAQAKKCKLVRSVVS